MSSLSHHEIKKYVHHVPYFELIFKGTVQHKAIAVKFVTLYAMAIVIFSESFH